MTHADVSWLWAGAPQDGERRDALERLSRNFNAAHPLAEAEALIDPNDPAVIERAERAAAYCIGRNFPSDRTAWTILAALRSKGGTDAR